MHIEILWHLFWLIKKVVNMGNVTGTAGIPVTFDSVVWVQPEFSKQSFLKSFGEDGHTNTSSLSLQMFRSPYASTVTGHAAQPFAALL